MVTDNARADHVWLEATQKSRNPRWSPFEYLTLFVRHLMSSANVVDLKGNIFGGTTSPLNSVVTA